MSLRASIVAGAIAIGTVVAAGELGPAMIGRPLKTENSAGLQVRKLSIVFEGAPDVMVVAPSGRRIALEDGGTTLDEIANAWMEVQTVDAIAEKTREAEQTYCVVDKPEVGMWRVRATPRDSMALKLEVEWTLEGGHSCVAGDTLTLQKNVSQWWRIGWTGRTRSGGCLAKAVRFIPRKESDRLK